jgi:hypothetical protein
MSAAAGDGARDAARAEIICRAPIDEGSGTQNADFFDRAFGVVAGARRFIVLKPAGSTTVAPHVVFVQSSRADTKSIVRTSALPDCVFTCVEHGAGTAAGEAFVGGS